MNFIERNALRSFDPDDIIFQEEDTGNSMYIIQTGKVEISKESNGSKIILAVLDKGSVFGEMALIDGRARSATATAVTATQCLEISRMLFKKHLEEVPNWLKAFVQILSERLRESNKKLNPVSDDEVSQQSVYLVSKNMEGRSPNRLDEISIPWKPMARDISFVLHQPFERIEKVLNKLTLSDMAKSEMNHEYGRLFVITDTEKFQQFSDYCRARYAEKHGEKIENQFSKRSECEAALIKFLWDLIRGQGNANDVEYHFLESRLNEEMYGGFNDFKHEFSLLKNLGVYETRLNGDDERFFLFDRERLRKLVDVDETISSFETLESKL